MKLLNNITPLEKDFARWYQDVVIKGDLISYSGAKGFMVFKPNSYGIWERIQKEMNLYFKKMNIQNLYLPLLIPLNFIEKEKNHIKGFAPELITISHVGEKKLDQLLTIRPTSEVLFGKLFAEIIGSHNDLPIYYNQWANVVRWEKTTQPFLRNREFLWQEGHTVHKNSQEARQFTKKIIQFYARFLKEYLAIPVLMGKKTEKEKFAGAVSTYTIEAMMKDNKALQVGTSHYLGTNFAKTFDIKFKNTENKEVFAYQTSWGMSTRIIGALIMTHGDNRGLIIPPRIAPYQVIVVDFFGEKNANVRNKAIEIANQLAQDFRVKTDFSKKSPGKKAAQSEIEGIPLRIEIGPRDISQNLVTLVRRDTQEKIIVEIDQILTKTKNLLKSIQDSLLTQATNRLKSNFVEAFSYKELKEQLGKKNFVLVPFAGQSSEEDLIKKETLATARCILMNLKKPKIKCILTKKLTNRYVVFSRAY